MQTLVLLLAFSVLITSCLIFYGLTKFMHYETKDPSYNIKVELLIMSGFWVFSKSHFNENLDARFTVGRVCLLLIMISIFTIFKMY